MKLNTDNGFLKNYLWLNHWSDVTSCKSSQRKMEFKQHLFSSKWHSTHYIHENISFFKFKNTSWFSFTSLLCPLSIDFSIYKFKKISQKKDEEDLIFQTLRGVVCLCFFIADRFINICICIFILCANFRLCILIYTYTCVYVRGWHWFVLLVHSLSVIMKLLVCCVVPHGKLISA